MHHVLYCLTSHPDVTRFEVEDGVVRQAAAELLSEETTIDTIAIDLGIFVREGAAETPAAGYDVLVSISGGTAEDVSPSEFAELVAEVAVVSSSTPISIDELSQLEKEWVGTTTPGPKVTAHFNPAASDSADYRDQIEALARSVVASIGNVGCRVVHSTPTDGWPFATSLGYWFANNAEAKEAFERDAFDLLSSSSLIAPNSFVLTESIEHRIAPNPNTWTTNDGVEPPAPA